MSDKNEAAYAEAYEQDEKGITLPDEAPFEVGEEIEVGDLSTVQDDIMPASKGVLVEIRKAAVKSTGDMGMKYLNLQMTLPNGIATQNADGELVARYVNKIVFNSMMDLVVWAGPTKTSAWFQERKHLLGFKEFCRALGLDLTSIKINDRFCERLIGRRLLVNIKHEAETELVDGKREKTGKMRERYTGWKAAPQEAE